MASFLRKHGAKTVVIKLGAQGAYIESENESFYEPVYAVPVVDTTGAGDSFVSGFLSRFVKKAPFSECMTFAAAVAAHCIREVGSTTGIPNEAAVLEFIKLNRRH